MIVPFSTYAADFPATRDPAFPERRCFGSERPVFWVTGTRDPVFAHAPDPDVDNVEAVCHEPVDS